MTPSSWRLFVRSSRLFIVRLLLCPFVASLHCQAFIMSIRRVSSSSGFYYVHSSRLIIVRLLLCPSVATLHRQVFIMSIRRVSSLSGFYYVHSSRLFIVRLLLCPFVASLHRQVLFCESPRGDYPSHVPTDSRPLTPLIPKIQAKNT